MAHGPTPPKRDGAGSRWRPVAGATCVSNRHRAMMSSSSGFRNSSGATWTVCLGQAPELGDGGALFLYICAEPRVPRNGALSRSISLAPGMRTMRRFRACASPAVGTGTQSISPRDRIGRSEVSPSHGAPFSSPCCKVQVRGLPSPPPPATLQILSQDALHLSPVLPSARTADDFIAIAIFIREQGAPEAML